MSTSSPHTYLKQTGPDRCADLYTAEILSAREYSAYGAELPGYAWESGEGYRYGFNGQEKESSITGSASHTSAEFWMYDSRLGRRWNVDPVKKDHESVYAAFANNPIFLIDPNGADTLDVYSKSLNENGEDWVEGEKRLFLFRVYTGDQRKGEILSDEFRANYQMLSPNIEYVENGSSVVRIYAQFLYANSNMELLSKSIHVIDVSSIANICKDALNAVGGKLGGLNNVEKLVNFDHEKKYDYKHSFAGNKPFTFIQGVGVLESDHLGNMIYGYVAQSAGQDMFESFYDGDFLSRDGRVDDVYDSYSLAFGARVLWEGITRQNLLWGRNNFYLKKNVQFTDTSIRHEFRGDVSISITRHYSIGYYAQFGTWIRHGQYTMNK